VLKVFTLFDGVAEHRGPKIKTIGDAYMRSRACPPSSVTITRRGAWR
jgi:hypothetical protein